MSLTNWGNYPVIEANFSSFSSLKELSSLIGDKDPLIARGLGRCYGDSALAPNVISTQKFNRILAFDDNTGVITCESGVSFAELVEFFVPRGWFLPVTPGTKFVTVGGAIASDVHGKNHHVSGSFSRHILSMKVMTANGEIVTCSKEDNSDLFWATCGGMGLTGVIVEATFALQKIETCYIRQEKIKARNLDEIMALFEESQNWTYSVAWIDCLAKGKSQGRSIMMRGEHATSHEIPSCFDLLKPEPKQTSSIPFYFPSFALNSLSVKAFNFLYYHKCPEGLTQNITDFETFFYPLDAVHHWNRIYGKRGFTQYQFVLPKIKAKEGLKKILDAISQSGQGSFLAVLKLFGKQDDVLSFPHEGYTLALDFAITPILWELLDRLDELVLTYEGRLYLTKDVRMKKKVFEKSYPNAKKFWEIKKKVDPKQKFMSLQSQRVFGIETE